MNRLCQSCHHTQQVEHANGRLLCNLFSAMCSSLDYASYNVRSDAGLFAISNRENRYNVWHGSSRR